MNTPLLMGAYLVLLSASIVAAYSPNARFRSGLLETSVFGVVYFATVLRCGFVQSTQWHAENTQLGLAFLGIAFLLSQLLTTLVWRPSGDSDAS